MKSAKSIGLLLLVLLLSICCIAQTALKIRAGATLDLNGGVILTLQNIDLDNDGTLSPAVNAGRVLFKGNANSLIRGNGTTNFDQLEINKVGGAALILHTDFNIRGGIYFTMGNINLNNKVVTLLGNSALNGESILSHTFDLNGGYVQLSMQLNAPKIVNPGNLGATISSGSNLGLTTIRRGHQQQTIEAGRTSIRRYYDIVPENTVNPNATVRFEYDPTELDGQSEDALEFRIQSSGGKWEKLNSTNRNAAQNWLEITNLAGFGRLTLADDGAGLPVIFKSFTVECRNDGALINWVTSSEENSSHFEVERSTNGTSWSTIATLPAAGNSSIDIKYTYTDAQRQGKFYRIKEVDLDGKTQYSQVIVADCATGNVFKAWPNPVQEKLFITLKAERLGTVDIKIFNSEGKLVKKQNYGVLAGNNQLALDMYTLNTGYYHIEVTGNDGLRKALTVFKK